MNRLAVLLTMILCMGSAHAQTIQGSPLSSTDVTTALGYFPAAIGAPPTQTKQAIGNTQFVAPDINFNDATDNSLNSRKIAFAPTGSAITDIQVCYPGWGLNAPEQNFPVSYTVTASIEYPIGSTPSQLFANGAASITVAPGRVLPCFDPLSINIPAGAQFAAKTYATWSAGNFWMMVYSASQLVGEWTNRGTGLSDHTLDNAVFTTTSNVSGFGPTIYANEQTKTPVVGIVGDSIAQLTADWVDTNVGHNGWGRAMRNVVPFINLGRGSDTDVLYFSRNEGRNLVLRSGVTHVIWQMGSNDLYNSVSLATLQTYLQSAINPFLDRGVKVYAVTFMPRTTSTDGFITAVNQTIVSAPIEATRIAYNAWLRANWQSLGLSGYFDLAHAADPTDSGKWSFDPALPNAGNTAAGGAVLSGSSVASMGLWFYNGNASIGSGYANNSNVPCIVYSYPGTPGSGATAHMVTNSSGQAASFVIDTPGTGYTYPPMVTPQGPFTDDGTHFNTRGTQEMIYRTGLAPSVFTLH